MKSRVTIHTPESLRKSARRLDRRNARQQRNAVAAAAVLQAMRNGPALHRCNREHRTIWALSTGAFVPGEVVEEVQRRCAGSWCRRCLFGRELSQTFRYTEQPISDQAASEST